MLNNVQIKCEYPSNQWPAPLQLDAGQSAIHFPRYKFYVDIDLKSNFWAILVF
jgi:hypothetical protein